MTDRLYYTDSYLREFDAAVVERADEGRRVYLDRTAFYPTSGGQPFDHGWLGNSPVVDVVDEGDRVAHLLAVPIGSGTVTGRVDWTRRFDHMQQHTGQHLLSAVISGLFGHDTVSVHFGAESSTIDLNAAAIGPGDVADAERRTNEIVMDNRQVSVSFEDAATAPGLRKTPERTGTLRIVTIEGLDRSACGGTHVRTTGEIGAVLIRKVERVKQLVRLEFLCGGRSVRRARVDADLLARLSVSFSATPDELPELVETRKAELKRLSAENRDLGERLSTYRAAELYSAAAADSSGRRLVVLRDESGPVESLRVLAQAVARRSGAVFLAASGNPPTVLLAAAPDSGTDAGQILGTILRQVGGRGGGNSRLAQGTVPDQAAFEAVVRAVRG